MAAEVIKLLDLYCGAAACSVGYEMAADDLGIPIQITGVDIIDQPICFPPMYDFVKGDAIKFLLKHSKEFTHVHASPPCQRYSRLNVIHKKYYRDLIGPTREALRECGSPYIIENVPGSPLVGPLKLNGQMFGLKVIRERWFETSFFILQPQGERRRGNSIRYRRDGGEYYIMAGHNPGSIREWNEASGVYWMYDKDYLSQAIPPSYTHWLGLHWFERKKNAD